MTTCECEILEALGLLAQSVTDSGMSDSDIEEVLQSFFDGQLRDNSDAYRLLLGRLPEAAARLRMASSDRNPTREAIRIVKSAEFQIALPRLLADCRPERRRIFFVHIPKAAGSSVKQGLNSDPRFTVHDSIDELPGWHGEGERLRLGLRKLGSYFGGEDPSLVFTGHAPLTRYITERLIRPEDLAFTVIREPQELILSQAKYIFRSLKRAPNRLDSKRWAKWLPQGLDPDPLTNVDRLLSSRQFAEQYSEMIHRYLGGVGQSTTQSFDLVLKSGCAVIEADRISISLEQLGLPVSESRINESRLDVNIMDLPFQTQLDVLPLLVGRDITLFRALQEVARTEGYQNLG